MQHAVERSLISKGAKELRLTVFEMRDAQPCKPAAPMLVKMPFDANAIQLLCHCATTFFQLMTVLSSVRYPLQSGHVHLTYF